MEIFGKEKRVPSEGPRFVVHEGEELWKEQDEMELSENEGRIEHSSALRFIFKKEEKYEKGTKTMDGSTDWMEG